MARKPRISFHGALHHVIMRGNHKELIFLTDIDRNRFIKVIDNYRRLYLFKCYAYALMPNHIHLLVEESQFPLPRIMQGINQSYTQYFNRKYKQIGHLFHGRYKSILCDKDKYLLILIQYIHLNPVRANIVCNPEDYRWSSHKDYLIGSTESLVDTNSVLPLFSSQKREAIERYRNFITDAIGRKLEQDLENGITLGDDEFTENIKKKHTYEQLHGATKVTLGKITTLVASHFGVSKHHLCTKCREKQLCKIRGLIGYLAREFTEADNAEIARYFNHTASTMSHAVQETIRMAQEDPAFSEVIEIFSKSLRKL